MKEGKVFKRILAMTLVVVMAITMVPFGVYATGEACTHEFGYIEHAVVPATCITTGTGKYYECESCHKNFSDSALKNEITTIPVIEKAAHTWSSWVKGEDSTCTVAGKYGYYSCNECGFKSANKTDELVELNKPLAAHDWNATSGKCNDCQTPCTHTWSEGKCSVCKMVCGHTGGAATCKVKATCTTCGEKYGDFGVHNYATTYTVDTPASCMAKGSESKHCLVEGCDAKTGARDISKVAHTFDKTLANGKCTVTGCTGTCSHTGGTATCTEKATCETCGMKYGSVRQHEMETSVVAPTCYAKGYTLHKCKFCDHSYTDTPTDKVAHTLDNGTITTPATCEAKGVKTFTCTVTECNYTETEEVAKVPHTAVAIPEVEAKCGVKGSKGGQKCSECDEELVPPVESPALEHDLEITPAVAATCETAGKTKGEKCMRDGCTYEKAQEPIAALDHAWSTTKQQTLAPTCTTKGSKAIVCTRTDCDAVQTNTTEEVDKLPHDYTGQTETETVKATCTTKGEKAILCKNCNTAKKEGSVKEVAALGHDWDGGTVKKEPTCTAKGSTTYKCNRCKITEDREVAALGHDIEEQVTEATCTTDGYTTFKCKECDYYYVDDVVEAFGHSFITYVYDANSATCYKDGTKTAECDYGCGATDTIDDVDSKIEHQPTEFKTLKPATCTEEGEEESKCFYYEQCGYSETYPTDPLGHTITDKTEYTVDKEPDCVNKGSKSKHCERCEYTEGAVEIDALGHDYKDAPGTTATCTKGGYAKFVCARCSDSYEEANADALGHDWNDGTVVVEPKCEEKGKATYTCNRCTITEDRDVDAIGHQAGSAIVIPATTEANGSSIKTCIRCTKEIENVEIAKIAKLSLKYKKTTYDGSKKIPKLTITDANGNALVKGTDYTVVIPTNEESAKIGTHTYTVTFKGNYEGEEEVSYKVLPGTSSKVTAEKKQTEIKLTWKAVKGAVGYRVYVYNKDTKKYDIVAKYVKDGKTSYTVKNLKANTTYKFAIKAYGKDDDGKVIWAAESLKASFKTLVTKTSKLTATPSTTSVKLSWKKVSGADGYRVYVYNTKTKKYSIVEKNVTGTSYTVKGLKAGTSYKFAVKAYDTVSKKTVWSNQYTTVKVTTKK